MCRIKDKAGSIIQCKISDMPLVWKPGPATISRTSVKISSTIWIYSVRFIPIISFISFDLCNLGSIENFEILWHRLVRKSHSLFVIFELEQFEQAIQNIINSLKFNNEQQQLLQVKYKYKLKEDEKRNTDNWNDYSDKLKATYEKEQEWNDIDDLLKYADKQFQNENVAGNNKCTQKTTWVNITDHATNLKESIKFI